MRKIGVVGTVFGLCVVYVLFSADFVSSSQSQKIAGNQQVIVKSNSKVSSGKQIGKTDYYSVDANTARNLRSKDHQTETHAIQSYKPMITVNDPLEPQSYLTLLNANDAWDVSTGNSSTVVAVIDSGVAHEHEDLTGRWAQNADEMGATGSEGPAPNCTSRSLSLDKSCNNLDDDSNGFVDDWRGWDFASSDNDPSAGTTNPTGDAVHHGTAVSGMVGATGNNSLGVASVNWNTQLLPLQVFTDDGDATTVEVAEALSYAIDAGVDVVNMSLGSAASDSVIESLLADAEAAGITVVASAGNCGDANYALNGCSFQGQMLYPATSDLTISVVGTNLSDDQASFSSEGSMADIGAPAIGSLKTTLYDPDDAQGAYSSSIAGTSFSAPTVSGMAASILDVWPGASPEEVRDMIIDTALKVDQMDGKAHTNKHGFGRLRPTNALELAQTCQDVAVPEDINCDESVGLLDLSLLANQWQTDRTGRSDINGSGTTELLDLSLLASKWGT